MTQHVVVSLIMETHEQHMKILYSIVLAPVVRRMDMTVHGINHYLLNNPKGFRGIYPMDSASSAGKYCPTFEQL